ncbi:MAG: methyl-accepting chemotaxis protein, partial [Gammaproteobacteria bacterium]|nr:methyl-accepting chemotaxis protein [Gammaproteobacteria bacterium]
KLIEQLEELLKRLDAEAKVTADEAAQAYKTAASVMVTIGILAIALGVLIALAITRSIVYPLNFAVRVAKRIAAGDLTSRIEVRGSDETADLMAALSEMNASLGRIISSVQKASDNVASLGDDLSCSTGQVTQRATSQSERVMAVSAAMEQMSVAVTQISRGAEGVREASTQTQGIVQENDQNMERSVAATQRIMETVESSGAAIGELGAAIQKITEVTQVIKSIADQTNLLALNAAIEAARAGEQGRGFAVVADEVRVLAQRTSTSTADIANMIGAVKQKATDVVQTMERVKAEVNEGARATDTVSQSLRRIVESALRVTELAHQIANATREQTGATDETAKNMEMISQLTAQNTDNILAVEKTAGNLTHTAHELASLVAQFKLTHQ